jgi:hypothetical protein
MGTQSGIDARTSTEVVAETQPQVSTTAQRRGRIGGLTRAATAPSPQAITEAARAEKWRRYRQQVLDVLPELEGNDAEIDRRAGLLRRADMVRLSQKAAKKRSLEKRIRDLEAELASSATAETELAAADEL